MICTCTLRITGWHLSSVQMPIWSVSFVGRWSFLGPGIATRTDTNLVQTQLNTKSYRNCWRYGPKHLDIVNHPALPKFKMEPTVKVMVSKIGISYSRVPVSGELIGRVNAWQKVPSPSNLSLFVAKLPKARRKPCPTKRPHHEKTKIHSMNNMMGYYKTNFW